MMMMMIMIFWINFFVVDQNHRLLVPSCTTIAVFVARTQLQRWEPRLRRSCPALVHLQCVDVNDRCVTMWPPCTICGNRCFMHIATINKVEILFTTVLKSRIYFTFFLDCSLSLYTCLWPFWPSFSSQERADRETTEETLLKLLEAGMAGTCRKFFSVWPPRCTTGTGISM